MAISPAAERLQPRLSAFSQSKTSRLRNHCVSTQVGIHTLAASTVPRSGNRHRHVSHARARAKKGRTQSKKAREEKKTQAAAHRCATCNTCFMFSAHTRSRHPTQETQKRKTRAPPPVRSLLLYFMYLNTTKITLI